MKQIQGSPKKTIAVIMKKTMGCLSPAAGHMLNTATWNFCLLKLLILPIRPRPRAWLGRLELWQIYWGECEIFLGHKPQLVQGIEMSRRYGYGIIIEEWTSQNDLRKIFRNFPVCNGTGLFCSLDMDASASDRVAPSTFVKVLRPFTKGLPTYKQMDFDAAPLYNHFFITVLLP